MRTESIAKIVEDLSQLESNQRTFNPYADDNNPDNAIRRSNLTTYLQQIKARRPKTLMVMEAPGYRGCRLTGIPVTSRRWMLDGVPELDFMGEDNGYRDVNDEGFESIQGEQSATIVWQTLADLGKLPLIWNTFPLHPHQPHNPQSNRRPLKEETELGGEFLRTIFMLFKPEVIIAVGNIAHMTIASLGVNCVKVRHPAQGGKHDFVAGMTRMLT